MGDGIERYLDDRLAAQLDRREFLQVGLTVAGAAVFAACGGTTSGGPSGPTGPEFKLGVVLRYSGVYAELGTRITNGMRMYFDSFGNEAGNRTFTWETAEGQGSIATEM